MEKRLIILQGASAILKKFKGYFHALKSLFPDVKLSHTEFLRGICYEESRGLRGR